MYYYLCRRCLYKTKNKIDIKRHLNRKIKCLKNVNTVLIPDSELITLSLVKIEDNSNIEDFKNSKNKICPNIIPEKKIIEKTENENENKIDESDKNNFKCNKCMKDFNRVSSLKRHQRQSCNKIIIENNTLNTTTNNNTTNNILNINLNIDNKITKIIPFDEDWDISKLDNATKQALLMSSIKFTKTMEKILENDMNMNVLIEKENGNGMGIVYKNDEERFKEMNINDIVDKSMTKLYRHLKKFYEEIKDDNEYGIYNKYLDEENKMIEIKYDDFQRNLSTQKIVQSHLMDIYDKNKDKTITNYKNNDYDNSIGF